MQKPTENEPSQSSAQTRLIAEQLQARGIRNERVLRAFARVPRERFVPEDARGAAYEDRALPIACEQTISQPYVVARMTDLLGLKGAERVLEIGTGSGYQTAILAELADEVFSQERHAPLQEEAANRLDALGYRNVHLRVGDGTLGWPEAAPFDRILVTAAGPELPPPLIEQLGRGGRLVAPIGGAELQQLVVVERDEYGQLRESAHDEVRFVPLLGRFGW